MSVLESVLLRRLRTVHVDPAEARPGGASTAEGLAALEAELLERGFAPTRRLRDALAQSGPSGLARTGKRLLRQLDADLGADRTHTPLFRDFPRSTPDDTFRLYVDRVFTLLLQSPEQPCVLCGTVGAVRPVSPCAHLVCRRCWDGADYSGCPLCHRRIDGGDPFLRPSPAARAPEPPAGPLRLLDLGTDRSAEAARALADLLGRRTPCRRRTGTTWRSSWGTLRPRSTGCRTTCPYGSRRPSSWGGCSPLPARGGPPRRCCRAV
ncbi:RING finger family 4 domain-containing protein [Streptomyces sp. CC228A]|uniref:RING finger family 4 domain-containing protein n=1 Tax=Streptomyces sp. CC228A TaxID=2898186 RepID=UPI001F2CFE7C|nr:RING finger family 4 domain-containing protein [Streptomyces sp. CC228A]